MYAYIGTPHFIVFHKLKSKPSTSKRTAARFMAILALYSNGLELNLQYIAEVCLYLFAFALEISGRIRKKLHLLDYVCGG